MLSVVCTNIGDLFKFSEQAKVEKMVKRFEELIALAPEPKNIGAFIENTIRYRSKNEVYNKLDATLRMVNKLR